MDNLRNLGIGGVVTLLIGGTAFTFSQQDVINNFAADSGLTQEQAEQYINDIPEDELASWDEIGTTFLGVSKETLVVANDIDCVNYEYEWESPTLSCSSGKAQLQKVAATEQLLGEAYIKLDSDTSTEGDIQTVISYLDQLNSEYELEASTAIFDGAILDELKMTNLYNKSLLTSALESI